MSHTVAMGPPWIDLSAGQDSNSGFDSMPASIESRQGWRWCALAVSTLARSAISLAGTPTVSEFVPGYEF